MDTSLAKVLEFRIPADTRYIGLVRRGIRSLAESVGFAREEVADVEVAVSEAVANSVIHGSPYAASSAVIVKCHASGECLVIEVEDESTTGSPPSCPPHCDSALEGGRGVMMMHALMDECENSFTDRGMKVRMAKQKIR